MRNGRLSWLTLGLVGLLLGTPSCGDDEAVGDDDMGSGGSTNAHAECELCESSAECRRPSECIQLAGVADKVGACAAPGSTMCCDLSNPNQCRSNLSGVSVEEAASGGSNGVGGSNGGSGGSLLGGSGGTSGKGGSSAGGSSGSGSSNTTRLGAPCRSDGDCADDRMFCLASDGLEDGSGPPNGLCTLECTSDGQCFELTDNTYCVQFSDTEAYCMESCVTGSAGEPKCQERTDFACSALGLIPGDDECETSDDCSGGQLCSTDGVCGDVVTGCLPTCGGDFDCETGFCDFLSGFCVEDKDDDLLPIGSACVPPDDNEPEPCDGFCIPTNDAGTEGECAAFCVSTETGVGCGFDGSEPADAACLFGTILSPQNDVGFGDVMLCGKLCDCNDECPISGDRCVDETEGIVMDVWGRNGYCRQLDDTESESDTFSDCPPGSTGGTGGGGSGGSGNAGDTGNAGESSSGQGGQSGT
jgi:hypothetical protein